MRFKFTALCFFSLFTSLCVAQGLDNATFSQRTDTSQSAPTIQIPAWTSPRVQHAYGLPESKPKARGTLTVNSTGITFHSKAGEYTVPWGSMIALSNGNERVELWGTTGRIVRMMIPNGGGLAAAGVMHHKVYELTVEFHDARGAYHAAVFLLPGVDATRVLDSYTQAVPAARHEAAGTDAVSIPTSQDSSPCGSPDSHNVLVAAPVWSQAEVPAAYRALVYEHIVDRLQRVEGVGHVYRAGERSTMSACPRYTVAISVVSFKPGSQVIRAATGPIGFFAGTTQMIFNVQIADGAGGLHANEQIKASARGESESRNVADAVAKKLAKSYATSIKQYEKSKPAVSEQHPLPLAPS